MEHDNDNVPVFDRRDALPCIVDAATEWRPPRPHFRAAGATVRFLSDGPTEEHRIKAGQAWYSSQFFSGQHANDNKDWPLAKLLRTERNDHCLALAERYRGLHDIATGPTHLIGREAVDLYVVHNVDKNGKDKGVEVITGKKANIDTAPRRAVVTNDETKKRASPVPKKWNGDWPLLASIDAKRELAVLRAKLAYVPAILDGFEWAVVDGLTLAEIGARLGAGSKGAKGEARARIFDGFGIIDRHWQRYVDTVSKPKTPDAMAWSDSIPVPAGYYRSKLHPGTIFLKSQAAA